MEAGMLTRLKIAWAVLCGKKGVIWNCDLYTVQMPPNVRNLTVSNCRMHAR